MAVQETRPRKTQSQFPAALGFGADPADHRACASIRYQSRGWETRGSQRRGTPRGGVRKKVRQHPWPSLAPAMVPCGRGGGRLQ